MQFPDHLTYKIVLLGDQCVGKSSLLNRFVKGNYSPHYVQTYGADLFLKDTEVESNPLKLVLYDSMGQADMKTIVRSIYRDAMGIMLVFEFTRADTLKRVKEWLDLIELVAKSHGLDFIEVSAKTGYNVEMAFVTLVNKIYINRKRLTRGNMITSIRLTDKPKQDRRECCN